VKRAKVTQKKVPGDAFILCTLDLIHGPCVIDTDDNLPALLSRLPEAFTDEDRISVCRVGHWTIDVPGDETHSTPRDLKTIFEIEPHDLDAVDDS
jgi:hypothetical protein